MLAGITGVDRIEVSASNLIYEAVIESVTDVISAFLDLLLSVSYFFRLGCFPFFSYGPVVVITDGGVSCTRSRFSY